MRDGPELIVLCIFVILYQRAKYCTNSVLCPMRAKYRTNYRILIALRCKTVPLLHLRVMKYAPLVKEVPADHVRQWMPAASPLATVETSRPLAEKTWSEARVPDGIAAENVRRSENSAGKTRSSNPGFPPFRPAMPLGVEL